MLQKGKKRYELVVVISFFLLLVGFALAQLCLPDKSISVSERRYYQSLPEFSWEEVLSGRYMREMEKYLLDQFVGRDAFRIAKTEIETTFLGKTDANDYVKEDGYLFELDYDWSKTQVTKTAKNFAKLQEKWFSDARVFYAVIPDKASFLPKEKYPVDDNGWVLGQMKEYLTDASYIDLFPYLELGDYYKTDLHWRQEALLDVAEVLLSGMQAEYPVLSLEIEPQNEKEDKDRVLQTEDKDAAGAAAKNKYEKRLITTEFNGAYAGASAYQIKPDALYAMTGEEIEQASVYDFEEQKETSIYAPEKIGGTDSYDYYLWGARALLTVKNPLCENGRKLLLFRDSFGSSIAPLLLEGYEEITLVDLRYLKADYLPEFLDLTAYEDVLFLYSENILRNSGSLRF